MGLKYELLSNEEIIEQYKIIKEKERIRNKEAYERLKQNKVKYVLCWSLWASTSFFCAYNSSNLSLSSFLIWEIALLTISLGVT